MIESRNRVAPTYPGRLLNQTQILREVVRSRLRLFSNPPKQEHPAEAR